jgi:squalene cyclase
VQVPLGERKGAMIAYLLNHQQSDGGWGLHIESPSSVFGTVMSYVSLRLLGLPQDHASVKQAHAFIMTHGGAVMAPSWCKFWLAVLGLYDWDGINSIPAEMWLLPRWFPFHPGTPHSFHTHTQIILFFVVLVHCLMLYPPRTSPRCVVALRFSTLFLPLWLRLLCPP